MPDRQPLTCVEIFDMYIKMRRGGLSLEEAVARLEGDAFRLPKLERQQLNNDVLSWEDAQSQTQQHRSYTPSGPQRIPPQGMQPIQPIQPLNPIRPIQPPIPTIAAPGQRATAPNPFGTKFLDPSKVEALTAPNVQPVLCPKCGKKNAATSIHCITCGAVLKSLEVRTKRMDLPADEIGVEFKDPPRVYLLVRGWKQPIEVYLRTEMILGRVVAGAAMQPEVDLTPYDGENQGVSRVHASLQVENHTVVLTDLKSSNRTYVNGQRLYAHEARVLRHGDEIRLGKLVIKVLFKL